MNSSVDLSVTTLLLAYALLLIPFGIAWYFRIPLLRRSVLAILRMTGQLFMVGVVLIYLFRWDNPWLNMTWILSMVIFASYSAINTSELNYRIFLLPVFGALLLSALSILLFFNGVLLGLSNIFTAQYLIVIGGMLLGNALKGIIIGISDFFQQLEKDRRRYQYHLAAGAGQWEALVPFFRDSMKAALNPTIASMATMGVVFLPGMMTGQIIGGAPPDTAIRYQIAIMIAIFVCIVLSITLAILFSLRRCFDGYGNLKKEVFRSEN